MDSLARVRLAAGVLCALPLSMQRAQREIPSSKRAQQAAALQQLAELRARKGAARQRSHSGDENSSMAANAQVVAGGADRLAPAQGRAGSALPGTCLEDSDSGDDVKEQQALASPRSSAPQPLRRLRRLAAPAAAEAQAQTAAQAAAVGELAASLAGLRMLSAAGRLPDIATPSDAVTGVCSKGPVCVSSAQHSRAVDTRPTAACHAGLNSDVRSPLGSVDSGRREGAAGSTDSVQRSPGAGARRQSVPGDLVLGERSEYVLPSIVASKLYSHQVSTGSSCYPCLAVHALHYLPSRKPHGHTDTGTGLTKVEGVRWLFKLHTLQSGGILGDSLDCKYVWVDFDAPVIHATGTTKASV